MSNIKIPSLSKQQELRNWSGYFIEGREKQDNKKEL